MENSSAKERFDLSMKMNVLTSNELRPFLRFNDPFRSNSFAIILVNKGQFSFHHNFAESLMTKNDVYLITPGSLCELQEISADSEFLILGFKADFLKEQGVFFNGAELIHLFSTDVVHKFSLSDEEYFELSTLMLLLKKKIKMPNDMPFYKDIMRNSFLAVLYQIMIFYSKQRVITKSKLTRQEDLTTSFLALLVDHFKEEKRLNFYATQLCVTSRHLSQVVKKVTGKTAGEIIDDMVIKEAKILLSSNKLSVSQVSEELRFSDQSFFGKFFKKNTGICPSVYRSSSSVSLNPLF